LPRVRAAFAVVPGLDRVSAPLHGLFNFYRAHEQAKVQHQMIVAWVEGGPVRRGDRSEA
jgi:hypothetical protein